MALNYVTLTIDLFDGAGSYANGGTATFTPSVQLTDATDHEIITQAPVTAAFKPTGNPAVKLLATDNANVLPSGWAWTVTFTGVPGNPASFSFFLPFSGGASQNLSAISPVSTAVTQFPANPMTTLGDMIYGGASPAGTPQRLGIGTSGQVLKVSGGLPSWQTASSYQPWQFPVDAGLTNGTFTGSAKGDGIVVTDCVMSSGSPNIANTTSTPYTSTAVDGGKYILVSAAGGGTYSPKMFQISTVTDTGHAVLNANASSNTSGTPGSIGYFGTDDTAAIQAAVSAAVTYALAHNGYAEVVFSDKIYIIAGSFVIGGGTLGNAQITLPIIDPTTTAQQVVLAFKGAMDTTPLMHWLQVNPQSSGTVLASVRTDGTNDATYGAASVIGGPYNGYGGEVSGVFSNMLARVEGIGMLLPYNATMGGFDFFGLLEADVRSLTVQTAAVVPTSSAPVPSLNSTGNISNQWSFALRMPTTGNQVVCHVDRLSVEGLCVGWIPSEWSYGNFIHAMYCIAAVGPWCRPSGTMAHSIYINDVQAENCSIAVSPQSTGIIRMDIASLQAEVLGDSLIYDVSSQLQGTVYFRLLGSTGYLSSGIFHGSNSGTVNGAKHQRVINNLQDTGPLSSPQAAPATTVAWINYYFRDAWIEANLSGGNTFTSLTLTSANAVAVAQPGAVGASSYRFLLPSGASYTPAYSAGTLTHTVTLL